MPFITPVIEDSPLNFVEFVDAEFAQHPSVHNLYAGQEWEEKTYAPGVYQIPYKEPCEISDPIRLQFNCSYQNTAIPSLRLFKVVDKGNGRIAVPFYTFPSPSYTYVSGNSAILPNGNTEPLATFWWNGSFVQIPNIKPGIYYLVLTMGYSSQGNGTIDRSHTKKSAHIELKNRHNATIGITAKSKTNKDNTIFVQTQFEPFKRIPGALMEYVPDSEDTFYTNQRQTVTQLYSKPGHTKTLVIGGKRGVPQSVKAWANYAMSCDYKAVDGIEITKDDGSQWEPIGAGNPVYPLGGQSMTVREADAMRRYTTVIPAYVVLYNQPTYPFLVPRIAMHKSSTPGTIITLGTNFSIQSSADEQSMLAKAQAEVVRQGLKGFVAIVGRELRYINHYSEQYDTSDTAALTKYMEIGYNPASGATLSMSIEAKYVGVDWGDGTAVAYGTGTTANYNPVKTYAGTTYRTVRVYHNGSSISKFSTGVSGGASTISGIASSTMTEFQVISSQLSSFDASILVPSAATLVVMNLRNNKLTSLPNFLNAVANSTPFAVIKDVEFNGNRLSTANVDTVLTAIDLIASGVLTGSNNLNGVLALQNQTPPAPPSDVAPGSPYYNLVNSYSWTVNTDIDE